MNPPSEYDIQAFEPRHLESLIQLFKAVFNVEVSPEGFLKKYDTTTIGGKPIHYVAVERKTNKVVSHFGALPVKVTVGNHVFLAAQSSDAMTELSHQRKGLFKLLAEKVHTECRNRGISIIFSQPNHASLHSFVNVFNFQHIDNIIRWDLKLPFKTAPLAKIFNRSIFKAGYLWYSKALLNRYIVAPPEDITNPSTVDGSKVIRNSEYLEYKRSKNKFFIQINKAVLWIKLSDVLWIGEINNYDHITPEVLKKLQRIAFFLGLNTISFNINESGIHLDFLQKFKKYNSEPSTVFFLDEQYKTYNLILTGADFDTW